HLPAECFVEYQLRAQQLASSRFVATAAYGDGGPWYIPVKEAYPQGGYEVTVANCSDAVDDLLTTGIGKLLDGERPGTWPRLRCAINSAQMLTAISGTVCEPMSIPSGA